MPELTPEQTLWAQNNACWNCPTCGEPWDHTWAQPDHERGTVHGVCLVDTVIGTVIDGAKRRIPDWFFALLGTCGSSRPEKT